MEHQGSQQQDRPKTLDVKKLKRRNEASETTEGDSQPSQSGTSDVDTFQASQALLSDSEEVVVEDSDNSQGSATSTEQKEDKKFTQESKKYCYYTSNCKPSKEQCRTN